MKPILFTYYLLGIFFQLVFHSAEAQDSLKIKLGKALYHYGEFIDFEAALPHYHTEQKALTLNVWIDDIVSGKRWKYRYPFINGFVAGSFKVFSSIPWNKYAFNFILQDDFFNIEGLQTTTLDPVNELSYAIYLKNRQNFVETVPLNYDKSFHIKYLLFQDTAQFIFSPSQKKPAENNLLLKIKTSLDSVFTPLQTVTRIISIGDTGQLDATVQQRAKNYRLAVTPEDFRIHMPTVTITGKRVSPIQKFDRENTRGIFSANDAILLDGISGDAIARAGNLVDYIMSNVAGLGYEINDSGEKVLSWRGSPTSVFINELPVRELTDLDVNPVDIALIKIFRPSSFANSFGSGGGIIAIYTKTGELATRKYSFKIFGYNEFDVDWK